MRALYHILHEHQFQKFESFSEDAQKLSEELRWRAMWLAVMRGMSVHEIASVVYVRKISAGEDLGFLEWWGCKFLGHAHLNKTTPI